MSAPDVLAREDTQLQASSSASDVAHIVDQRPSSGQDVTTAYVEGSELVALCGYRWVPARSADQLPVCGECKAIIAGLSGVLSA